MAFPVEGSEFAHSCSRRKFVRNSLSLVGTAVTLLTHVEAHPQSQVNQPSPGSPQQDPAREASSKSKSKASYRVFDSHLHCPSDEVAGLVLLDRPQDLWQWYPVTRTFQDFV